MASPEPPSAPGGAEPAADLAAVEAPVAGATELKGHKAILVDHIDPFAPHLKFAWRFGIFANGSTRFLDLLRPPIDVRADKVLDLSKFGQEFKGFYKPVRQKQAAELKDDFDEQKLNLEPQFILRNLRRVVRESEPGQPLEFNRVPNAVKRLEPPPDMSKIYAPPELLPALGHDHARAERKWRRYMLEEMDWNRYFSREIKEKITGPLWAHDPDKAPPPAAAPAPVIEIPPEVLAAREAAREAAATAAYDGRAPEPSPDDDEPRGEFL